MVIWVDKIKHLVLKAPANLRLQRDLLTKPPIYQHLQAIVLLHPLL